MSEQKKKICKRKGQRKEKGRKKEKKTYAETVRRKTTRR